MSHVEVAEALEEVRGPVLRRPGGVGGGILVLGKDGGLLFGRADGEGPGLGVGEGAHGFKRLMGSFLSVARGFMRLFPYLVFAKKIIIDSTSNR